MATHPTTTPPAERRGTTVVDVSPPQVVYLRQGLRTLHATTMSKVLNLAEVISHSEHSWRAARHQLLDIFGEAERAMVQMVRQILQEQKTSE